TKVRAIDSPSFDRSAAEIVREIAVHRLAEARAALEQGDQEGAFGGQRAFRAALRNLQGLLDAYGSSTLDAAQLELALRGLCHILDPSAAVSDTEVQLRWLCVHLTPRSAAAREIHAELVRMLEGLHAHEQNCMRERVVPRFLAVHGDLVASLGWNRGRAA